MSTTEERDGSTLDSTRLGSADGSNGDGDDIVVITEPDSRRPPRRDMLIWIAAVGALLLAGVLASVVFGGQAHHTTVRTTSPTAAKVPAVVNTNPTPTTAPPVTTPTTNAVVVPVTPPVTTGHVVTPAHTGPAATTPPTIPATTPPTTPAPPKQYGPSALTWSAPHSMTVLAGSTAVLAVAAHNPTDGTVTLPHPLSCAPRLDHGEICPEVVQLLAHGTSAGAQYTIDAHGIAPGRYTLTIEGVLAVAVTVRATS